MPPYTHWLPIKPTLPEWVFYNHDINQFLADNENLNTPPLHDKINAMLGEYGAHTVKSAEATLAILKSLWYTQ